MKLNFEEWKKKKMEWIKNRLEYCAADECESNYENGMVLEIRKLKK